MDPRERKEILGQWGVRDPSPREVAEGRRIADDLEGSPVLGRPLERRAASPFRPSVESYVTALGGPLPYMARLREIDRLVEQAERELAGAWHELARACAGDEQAFGRRWREHCLGLDYVEANDLIERHNRWFPVEARLPMDPRRRDYVLVNGKPYRRERLDGDWALRRFPPRLREAQIAPLAASSASSSPPSPSSSP